MAWPRPQGATERCCYSRDEIACCGVAQRACMKRYYLLNRTEKLFTFFAVLS